METNNLNDYDLDDYEFQQARYEFAYPLTRSAFQTSPTKSSAGADNRLIATNRDENRGVKEAGR